MRALAGTFFLALFAAAGALAQDIQIAASVDRNRLALNEQLVLEVTVSGKTTSLPEPHLPSLPNFSAYSSGKSHNLSIVNGQVHGTAVHTFVLVPRFVGKAAIPPIPVEAGGRVFTTAPIEVVVERPSAPMPGGATPGPAQRPATAQAPDLFIRASVDKAEVFVNEQATLSVRFYTSVPLLGNPQYVPPQLQGFLSEDLPPHRNGQTVHNGRRYDFIEIKTALFPVEPGRSRISPAVVRAQVQEQGVDPFAPDFFQRFFSQGLLMGSERELRTEPLEIRVKALPKEGRPEDFKGAVGKYTLGAQTDKRELKVGEALNLTFTVRGEGNLKTASAPEVPATGSFRVYDAVSSLSLEKGGDLVRSVKEFKTVLVPLASGRLRIEPLRYSVFDPGRGTYLTLTAPPLAVHVLPGAAPSGPPAGAPEALVSVAEDIRYIREGSSPPFLDRCLRPIAKGRAWHALPMLVFLVTLGARSWRERAERDPEAARARRAHARAKTLVRRAERAFERQDMHGAAALLSDALSGYLADKLGEEARGLPFRKTVETLSRRYPGLAPERLEGLRRVWDELELLRFSPGSEQRAEPIARSVAEVLQAIEREAKNGR